MSIIARNLRYLRKQKGLTQNEFADIIYKSPEWLQNLEQGRRTPDLLSIQMLSTVFNVSIDTLINIDIQGMELVRQNISTYQHHQGL